MTHPILWAREQRPRGGEVSRLQGWNRLLILAQNAHLQTRRDRFPVPSGQFWGGGVASPVTCYQQPPALSRCPRQATKQPPALSDQPTTQAATSSRLLTVPNSLSSPLPLFASRPVVVLGTPPPPAPAPFPVHRPMAEL